MKRTLFVALLVLAFGSTMLAQQEAPSPANSNGISLDFKDAPRADILHAIASGSGMDIVFDDPITGSWSGQLTNVPLGDAIKAVLPEGYEAVNRDFVIHIRRIRPTSEPQPQATQPVAPEQTPRPQAQLSPYAPGIPVWALPNMYTVPPTYSPSLGMSEADWILARNRMPAPPPVPITPMISSGIGYPGYSTMGYSGGGYDGFYNPFMYRDYANQEKYGRLKIDGPEHFLQSVRVVIDGYDATVASKSNNRWNDPVVLTSGTHVIEFVRESKDGIVAFRRNINVVPMSVSHKPFWLRVTGNEFDNGREIYQYRQHRYVEQADGTVK